MAFGETMVHMLEEITAQLSEENRQALLDELYALLEQTEPQDLTLTEILALLAVLTPVAARKEGTPAPVVSLQTHVVPNNSAAQLE